MKTSNWIKLIRILCVVFGVTGISQSIFSTFLPKVIEFGNWPEQDPDLIGWGVKLGYLGILVYVFYLTAGILYLLRKPYSLVMLYFALSISILYKIVPLLFLSQYSSTSFIINFGFNILNLLGPAIDMALLIGVYMIGKHYFKSPEEYNELLGENKKRKINNKSKLGKICFYLNLIGTIYFLHLILLSYLKIDTQLTSFIRELFTIPFLLGGIALIILSIKAFKSDKYSLNSYSFWAIIVTTLNILILIFATIFNI